MNLLLLLLSLVLETANLSPSGQEQGIQAADETSTLGIEDASVDSDGAGRFRDRFVRR